MALNTVLANLVFVLHIAFVLWFLWAPFSGNESMIVLHALMFPFIAFHWILNQDTCALTLLERSLRGVSSEESFFHNLVSPIYKIEDSHMRVIAWVVGIGLWSVSVYKISQDTAMVKRSLWPPAAAAAEKARQSGGSTPEKGEAMV